VNLLKLSYFARGLSRVAVLPVCPNCGSRASENVDRKFLVTALRRCADCLLQFRVPTDDEAFNDRFYNRFYQQGMTTDLPSASELDHLKATGFAGTEKNYDKYIAILTAAGCGPGSRILDFGCSWGYGSWQLSQAGYMVKAYEISRQRAGYAGAKLGVDLIDDVAKFANGLAEEDKFDCFFSAHVLEHVPSPSAVIGLSRALLKEDGLFIAATPNGSAMFRKVQPQAWRKYWGLVHPNFLDEVFYRAAFAERPICLVSSHVDLAAISAFLAGSESVTGDLTGGELVLIAKGIT